MYGLKEFSTYGAHPKDFDPEQVKPVLVNLAITIKWYLRYNCISLKANPEEQTQVGKEPIAEGTKEGRITPQKKPAGLTIYKLLSGILIIPILFIAAIVMYPKILKKDTLERLRSSDGRISVAVMQFLNMPNYTVWDIWQVGIQANLLGLRDIHHFTESRHSTTAL